MRLSKNFELQEFLKSKIAEKENIEIQYNPPEHVKKNLKFFCEKVMQKIRDKHGSVKITSGYRCEKVNNLVGSKNTSFHIQGLSCDFQVENPKIVFDWIIDSLNFDKLIWEFDSWIHIQTRTDLKKNRKLVMRAYRDSKKNIVYEKINFK
jgi:hypothetical protein